MSAFLSKLNPFASETITVDNTVKTLTPATYNATSEFSGAASSQVVKTPRKAKAAKVVVDSANAIRVTEDLTTPVAATTGVVYNQNDTLFLESLEAIQKFKTTRDGASSSSLQVTYYR